MKKTNSVYKNESSYSYDISEERREEYRITSQKSRLAKLASSLGQTTRIHKKNKPKFNPNDLMPQLPRSNLSTLSLFSGGGGLDLGFDRAGFTHEASYELIPICGETLLSNRPNWKVYSGTEYGDVTKVDWTSYKGKIDVIHGGPPCQPFSIAGSQRGKRDSRNMWGEFNRAVNSIKPRAFVAENVLGLASAKFEEFVRKEILEELSEYHIQKFVLNSASFGVPQIRRRVFFVGFRFKKNYLKFKQPEPTHKISNQLSQDLFENDKPETIGVRKALGLSNIGYDNLAPTLRSGFTGKRNTTSILNSQAGQSYWGALEIWPNGVQISRETASKFPAENNHFRLSVQDCSLLQGFPEDWIFSGAVYQILGQLGNSVCPPVAYAIAKNLLNALEN
jgi:DNA (cytosine-5)-methyltransferase 1